MTFEELEDGWKSDLPKDGHLAPQDLRQRAIETSNNAEFQATVFEFWGIAIFGMVGIITLADAVLDAEPWHSYPPALITLGIAAFIHWSRRRRRGGDDFSGSLADMLENGLRTVDAQIARVNGFLWWYVLPTAVATGINIFFNFHGRPLWVWCLQPLGVFAFWVSMLMQTRASHLPQRKILKSLQSRLGGDS
ncbi:MAG: hypothetical protein AAF989_01515 [Planctomycetota bacterium]